MDQNEYTPKVRKIRNIIVDGGTLCATAVIGSTLGTLVPMPAKFLMKVVTIIGVGVIGSVTGSSIEREFGQNVDQMITAIHVIKTKIDESKDEENPEIVVEG